MARGYIKPLPGATVGRTDQGVDFSAAPGTPILAITKEKVMGVIQNWYQGQPFYWFQQLGPKGKPTGIYNYVAEQVQSGIRPGQIIQAGQPVGYVASSGTGVEAGFATRSGRTRAATQGGYTEGVPTAAGNAYKSQVVGGQTSNLAQLWIDAGGPPRLANTMAAIALAESSGRTSATNKNANGTVDRGLWQINSVHSQFDSQRLLNDPLYNAKAAVAVYNSQGLGAWTTYKNKAYRAFLHAGSNASVNYGGPGGGRTRPGGGGSDKTSLTADYTNLKNVQRDGGSLKQFFSAFSSSLNTVEGDITSPFQVFGDVSDLISETIKLIEELPMLLLRLTELLTGMILMGVGFWLALRPSGRGGGAINDLVTASPLGRVRRIRSATRAGRYEGETEHYRLAARKATRTKLETRRTQAAGKARHDASRNASN